MSHYRVVCTPLPHGPYQSGRMRLTLLFHLQYRGTEQTQLSSLSLYHRWTQGLKALLSSPDARHAVALKFYRLEGRPDVEPIPVHLPPTRLRPELWNALLADNTVVRSTAAAEAEEDKPLEFQSYSQAGTEDHLLSRSLRIAAGDFRADSYLPAFDLAAGNYPRFPMADEMEKAYGDVNPFEANCDLQAQKKALAAAGGQDPRVARDLARLMKFNPNGGLKDWAITAVTRIHDKKNAETASETQRMQQEVVKAFLFHRPIHHEDGHHTLSRSEQPLRELDFHERLSVFGNHPAILRPLGLAFDLEVQFAEQPGIHLVSADITGLLSGLGVEKPVEVAQPVSTAFKIRPVGGRRYSMLASRKDAGRAFEGAASHCDGMFDFGDGRNYALISTEPVAAMMRIAFASNEAAEADDLPGHKPHHLRGGGIALTVRDRARQAEQELAAARQFSQDLIFFSEDLVLGYRVDLQRHRFVGGQQRAADPWRSLCERTSEYKIVDRQDKQLATWTPDQSDQTINEGFIQESSYVQLPDSRSDEYQANGALFRWDNWSLAAPLPVDETVPDCDEIKHKPESGPPQHTGLKPLHAVKKRSLPKLEFNDGYFVRMRVVDLAGNSFTLNEAPETQPCILGASATYGGPYLHKRVEPIGAPEVLLAEAFRAEESPGEQLTHLVIRGEGTESAEDASGRFLVPPRVPQQFAELHGVAEPYDPARGAFFDSELNPNGPYMEMRPDGSFIRACDVWGECKEEPDCAPSQPQQQQQEPNPAESKQDADNPVYKFTSRARGEVENPFFPDPAARYARILLRGNKPDQLRGNKPDERKRDQFDFDFYRTGRWPNVIPFGVQLHGTDNADATMRWLRSSDPKSRRRDGAGDILAVYLPPSQTAHLLIHCLPTLKHKVSEETEPTARRGADAFALANELSRRLTGNVGKAQTGDLNTFQHWATSSPLVLRLVHAVEKPLDVPEFASLCVKYGPGDPKNERERCEAVPEPKSTAVWLAGDMECHRRSTGRLEIIARWEEPFDDLNKPDYDPRPVQHSASVFIKHLSTDESEAQQQTKRELPLPLPHGLRHDFGDTRYREVTYWIEASSRFKEYYPPTADDSRRFVVATPEGKAKTLTVLSRARPSLCVVNRVGPAFRWRMLPVEGKRDVIRERQCYVRVWIERTWFSAGEGEKLGVVLLPAGQQAAGHQPEAVGKLVSQWGVDPLWASPQIKRPLSRDDFGGYVDSDVNLKLAEAAFPVDVVAYDVQYSFERHMWYADIQVSPNNSYFPFVKLALARYQRRSIPGVELSAVALADPVQVFPARTVKVLRENSRLWAVSVEGASFDLSTERAKSNEMVFSIVERRSEDETDAGWVATRVKGQPIRVVAAPTGPAAASQWKAVLGLPDRKGRTRYAVLVEEFETWEIDKESSKVANRRGLDRDFTTRLVYADRIELR